jgi:hypothetical protein
MNMAEATVAIGTTLIGIALMIAFYAKAPQPLTEKQRHLETDRYQYGSKSTIDASAV